jgi:hypothetical protein
MRIPFVSSLLLLSAAVAAQAKDAKAAAAVDFEKQIWPILESRCVECHTNEAADGKKKKPKGGVTLDSKAGIEGSKKGKLVVAKKPDDSLLYVAITLPADHEERMPPEKAKNNKPLPKEQTELIKQWIEGGASFGKWTGAKPADKPKDGDKRKPGEQPDGTPPPERPKDPQKPKGPDKGGPDGSSPGAGPGKGPERKGG